MKPPESEAMRRMQHARTILLQDEFFYGQLAEKTPLVEDASIDTLDTNGQMIRFNPEFVLRRSGRQLRTDLAHEMDHCACGHPWRVGKRDLDIANEAADYIVNSHLEAANRASIARQLASGTKDPMAPFDTGGYLLDSRFNGMSLEQAYAILQHARRKKQEEKKQEEQRQKRQEEPGDDAGTEPGDDSTDDAGTEPNGDNPAVAGQGTEPGQDAGNEPADNSEDESDGTEEEDGDTGKDGTEEAAGKQPGQYRPGATTFSPAPEGTSREEEDESTPGLTESQWQQMTEEAMLTAKKWGSIAGEIERDVTASLDSITPWQVILREFLVSATRSSLRWETPNRRLAYSGLILPGPRRDGAPRIGGGVDLSGSISVKVASLFAGELTGIIREVQPEVLEVATFDWLVRDIREYAPGEDVVIRVKAGGGTSYVDLFRHFDENPPACLVVLTDLQCWFPPEPSYPVLWCTPEHITAVAPYGQTIRISEY